MTRFDLETYPLIKAQYAINVYKVDDFRAINQATVEVQNAMEHDPKIGFFTNFNPGAVAVGFLYADQPDEQPKAFHAFDKLEKLTTVVPKTNGTLLSLAVVMDFHQDAKKYEPRLSSYHLSAAILTRQ